MADAAALVGINGTEGRVRHVGEAFLEFFGAEAAVLVGINRIKTAAAVRAAAHAGHGGRILRAQNQQNGRCRLAYISDISAGSLQKARTLLSREVEEGRCIPVVADGLDGVGACDLVLIAGMGGEEIVRILERGYLPARFVLQPMKNSEKVRRFLIGRGCVITRDYTFEDGKFYDLIAGEFPGAADGAPSPADDYTEWEFRYGRDNLRSPSPAFIKWAREERRKLKEHLLSAMRQESREELRRKCYDLEVILDAIEGDV